MLYVKRLSLLHKRGGQDPYGSPDGQGSWDAGFCHVQAPSKVQNPGSFSSALMLGVRFMFNLERGWGTLTRHFDRQIEVTTIQALQDQMRRSLSLSLLCASSNSEQVTSEEANQSRPSAICCPLLSGKV